MKAVRIHQHGGPEVLKLEDVPDPICSSQDVLVQLKATSINYLDIWVRQGIPGWKVSLPMTPGCDGAGLVVGKGETVKDLQTGDKVLIIPNVSCGNCAFCSNGDDNLCPEYGIVGETCNGCDAEMISLPRRNVIPMPKGLTYEEAAAIPLVFMTAWHMLVTKAQVKPEQFVLVLAGGSGVGSSAIQIAKLHGAKVIATAGSEEKMEKAKALGADFVINHRKESISEKVREFTEKHGADIVVEHVGKATWDESLKSLAKCGKIVTCGATTGSEVTIDLKHLFYKHQQIIGSTMATRGELFEILNFVRQKKLKAVIDKEFFIKDVAEAHRYVDSGKQFGKVILTI
ncbi:MAG: zinc-binding dehydrogenase [Deltaproteobacteria bacterium]|nr:zinc-binding dehydrogenase [Deltaproteobacteria bacterium]